jgi:mono/diheme cytochrome c family protein
MRRGMIWIIAGLLLGAGLAAPGTSLAQDGHKIFEDKCAPCHGEKGEGNGPMAVTFDPKPQNFCSPAFWQGDVDKKINDAVTTGKGQMVPVDLKPAEIKAVTGYIKSSCKK